MKDWSGKSGRKSVNAMEKVAPANVLLDRDLQNFLRICPSFFCFSVFTLKLSFLFMGQFHMSRKEKTRKIYIQRDDDHEKRITFSLEI